VSADLAVQTVLTADLAVQTVLTADLAVQILVCLIIAPQQSFVRWSSNPRRPLSCIYSMCKHMLLVVHLSASPRPKWRSRLARQNWSGLQIRTLLNYDTTTYFEHRMV
jgi:hypothetical protein